MGFEAKTEVFFYFLHLSIKGKLMKFDKLDENALLNEIVKNAVSESFDTISTKYELNATQVEEVECRSRDGFSTSNDGGWSAQGFSDISMLTGSGKTSTLPEEVRKKIDTLELANNKYALDEFKSQNKEKLEELNLAEEDLTYHRLYDLGQGTLAEKLSELETSHNSDETSSIMFQVAAFLSRGEENGMRNMNVIVSVNWEAPYHRSGKDNEWFVQENFDFNNEFTLKSQLIATLKKLTGHLV